MAKSRRLGAPGYYTVYTGLTRYKRSAWRTLRLSAGAAFGLVAVSVLAPKFNIASPLPNRPVLAAVSASDPRATSHDSTPVTPSAAQPNTDYSLKLQKLLDSWSKSHGSQQWSVVIKDTRDTSDLATLNAHQTFFAASIYKLYVAYAGYQKIDDGTYSPDQPYVGNWTRGQCLDEMIRNSNSPCAEKMLTELGKNNLDSLLKTYGLSDTSMRTFTTSAADAAIILQRIAAGTDLTQTSQQKFLDSLLGQEYRNGLPKGFAPLPVYNKVGFQDYAEYHDVGLVKYPDGHYVIVSVFTKNVPAPRSIAQLAQAITRL